MHIPAPETTPPPLQPPPPLSATASLEAVELELSLGQKEIGDEQYETTIRETVEAVGGVLLFQMKIEEDEAGRWVAAVAFEGAEAREIAIIDLPCNGEGASVSPVSQSDLPIATIASAYAGLAECWTTAGQAQTGDGPASAAM